MPDPQFTQAEVTKMVQEAVAKREEQLRNAFKTDTLEGRVGELTKSVERLNSRVEDNHKKTWAKLDEVNHVKEAFNSRLDKTDLKIQDIMAAHMSSPQHSLMTDHLTKVSNVEAVLLSIPSKEFAIIPEMVHREAVQEENRGKHSIFAKTLEVRVTSLYGILGATSLLASGIIWLVTHISLR